MLKLNALRRRIAHIYFVDWDHARSSQTAGITVMGTTDEIEDRKWNNGETINTLRKYTDEEKADDIHYTAAKR